VDLPAPEADPHGALAALFAEELGLVLEVAEGQEGVVADYYAKMGVPCRIIGSTRTLQDVAISVAGWPEITGAGARLVVPVLQAVGADLRLCWAATVSQVCCGQFG
jgi:hypothetical protein